MKSQDPALERAIEKINLEDMWSSAGWTGTAAGLLAARLSTPFLLPFARAFARSMVKFDADADSSGLRDAAARYLRFFSPDLVVEGRDHVPMRGPVLFVSNHPGLCDTLALFAAIPRDDLRIIAAARPFLQSLPAASQRLIFVRESEGTRVIREAVGQLRGGGSVLSFPAGSIEADPQVHPDEADRVENWSGSTALILRMVPDCRVVPVRVSGVIAEGAQSNWISRFRSGRENREKLGASLQLAARFVFPRLWPIRPRVEFLEAIDARNGSPPESESISRLGAEELNGLIRRRYREKAFQRLQ